MHPEVRALAECGAGGPWGWACPGCEPPHATPPASLLTQEVGQGAGIVQPLLGLAGQPCFLCL